MGELRYEASDVHERTHKNPSTLYCLNRVYPHAIEIGEPVPKYSELSMRIAISVLIFMMLLWVFLFFDDYSLGDMLHWSVLISLVPVYIGMLGVWWVYRLNNWMPSRQVVMFNRKTRQVIAYQVRKPGFFRFWDTGKAQIKVLPWKNFRVRIYFCGGYYDKYNILGLFWSRRDHPEKLMDMIRVYKGGNDRNNSYLFRLWEHIRQYMEEHGPPIQPGEQLGPDSTEPPPFPDKIIRKAGGKTYDLEQIQSMASRNRNKY